MLCNVVYDGPSTFHKYDLCLVIVVGAHIDIRAEYKYTRKILPLRLVFRHQLTNYQYARFYAGQISWGGTMRVPRHCSPWLRRNRPSRPSSSATAQAGSCESSLTAALSLLYKRSPTCVSL